jgi:hypothetical protein
LHTATGLLQPRLRNIQSCVPVAKKKLENRKGKKRKEKNG